MRLLSLLACLICLTLVAPAAASDTPEPADPFVLLDAAKMKLGDGKLERGLKMMREIPSDSGEVFVDQEILYQQMLLSAAFLSSTHFLLDQVYSMGHAGSAYAEWLSGKRAAYAKEFHGYCVDYLEQTENGTSLEFIRFRLPKVTDDYLQDSELYADVQVLSAAIENWEDEREGLGRGVIIAQARIHVVMSAAVHYDMPEPSSTLEGVAARLREGVPINEVALLNWISSTAYTYSPKGGSLWDLAMEVDHRILVLTGLEQTNPLRKFAQARIEENTMEATTSN